MQLLDRHPPVKGAETATDTEALFPEARRRERRRRFAIGVAVIIIALGTGIAVAVTTAGPSPRRATSVSSVSNAGDLPTGPVVSLDVAGSLAVGANGALYVVDVARDRVLVRLPDGRFRVVAGDGKVGFSGDGGPAYRAELSSISDMTFGPGGALYIADGERVRVVSTNGVIRTIAGNGKPERTITNGTPALAASLGSPIYIAFYKSGQLYLSTSNQLLRLTAGDRMMTVPAVERTGPPGWRGNLNAFGQLALDAHGNIYVSTVYTGWSLYRVAPNGTATYVGYARRSGGNTAVVALGPHGDVEVGNASSIMRVEGDRLVPTFTFNQTLFGEYFSPTYFAYGPHGIIYADEMPGGVGFEAHQQLVSVTNVHVVLLWQEKNTVPK